MSNILDVPQNFSTTLNVGGGINNSQTTGITLTSVTGLPTDGGMLAFDWSSPINTSTIEYIEYSSLSSNDLAGVVRGQEGYTAKTHSNGCSVVGVVSRAHIKRLKDNFTVEHDRSAGTHTNAALTSMVGSPSQGDIIYRGSSTWARLGAGTSGQVLQTQGPGANPQWSTITTKAFFASSGGNYSQSSGSTFYLPLTFGGVSTGTEANIPYALPAGSIVGLYIYVITNTLNGTTTIKIRKNATSAGPSISVSASATGAFSDTTATSIALNDLVNLQIVTAGSAGSIVISSFLTVFSPT